MYVIQDFPGLLRLPDYIHASVWSGTLACRPKLPLNSKKSVLLSTSTNQADQSEQRFPEKCLQRQKFPLEVFLCQFWPEAVL